MGATGQTGTFPGHAIPASFFFGFGTFFLVLSLLRAQSLPPNGPTLCEAHVPERNASLLRAVGCVLMICTLLGLVYEAAGACATHGIPRDGCLFFQSTHETLYLSFCFVGLVSLLESRRSLPSDASRAALSLALLLEYVMWNEHALMKDDGTDQRVHIIMAQVCLVSSMVFAFSVYSPRSVGAYVGGWASLVLQSLWLITAGINADYNELERHRIGAYLCLEILVLAFVIALGTACCGGGGFAPIQQGEGLLNDDDGPSRGKEYEQLQFAVDGDDDEAELVVPPVVV